MPPPSFHHLRARDPQHRASEPRAAAAVVWYERYKPAAGRRAHLLASASMWTLAGLGLATFGSVRILQSQGRLAAVLFPAAIVVGVAKGRWILSRTARRNVARIHRRGDDRCLGGFLSGCGWALVALMVLLGRTLRHLAVAAPIVGPVYLAIGVALLVGGATLWRARRALPAGVGCRGSSRRSPRCDTGLTGILRFVSTLRLR
jgi:hypothetical protein